MNLYMVTCDNDETWAEDHDQYTTSCRANTEDEACAEALTDRGKSGWSATAELLVKDIDVMEKEHELFPRMVDVLKKVSALTDGDFAMDGTGFVDDMIKEIES
jgi:hypothetical protein